MAQFYFIEGTYTVITNGNTRGLKKKTKCINQEYQSLKGRFKAIRHVATVKEILVILLNIVTLNFSMFT